MTKFVRHILTWTWLSSTILAQNLYVADLERIVFDPAEKAGTILEFTPDGTRRVYAEDFTRPLAIVFDPDGNLYVGDLIRRAIFKITPDGRRSTFASPVSPYYLAVDSSGHLYMKGLANFDHETDIFKFSADGLATSFVSPQRAPGPLTFDAKGILWAIDNKFVQTGSFEGYRDTKIYQHSPAGLETLFKSALDSYATGLAFDRGGTLVYSGVGNYGSHTRGHILKFDSAANITVFASEFYPTALAINSSGELFVANKDSGEIFRFKSDGAQTTFASGIIEATSMTFAPPLKLQVTMGEGEITISWPPFATGFTLESASTLPATDWTPIERPGDPTSITLPTTGTAAAFRLRK